jgi:hypothetical protein
VEERGEVGGWAEWMGWARQEDWYALLENELNVQRFDDAGGTLKKGHTRVVSPNESKEDVCVFLVAGAKNTG